ncbi:GNAT family N-acetyltransferase [Roseimaritima sediminicola]|uniref:GNAT family N-acetyltransferase n=1 Tax=Roseimaritima sediminicola TaxID=2662066 RepID=UPI0012982510|nr:GNAT family N-acetyltransferase [Roseimaritima sediminicola]
MVDWTLRDATPEDLPELLEILNHYIRHSVASFRLAPLGPEAGRRWFASHADPRHPVVVATGPPDTDLPAAVTLAGWASLSAWSQYEAYAGTAEISIWLRPQCLRRGLGRRFMRHLLDRASGAGLRVVLSRVEASNEGSLRLHEAMGFRTIGTMHHVGEKDGRLLDVVMLERAVDSG